MVDDPYPILREQQSILKLISGQGTIGGLVEENCKRNGSLVDDDEEDGDCSNCSHSKDSPSCSEEAHHLHEHVDSASDRSHKAAKPAPERVLGAQIAESMNKNRIDQIFRDLLKATENRQYLNEDVTEYIKYKFKKTAVEQELSRLKMIHRLGLAEGPIFIICILKIISLHKQLFVLELEQGREV